MDLVLRKCRLCKRISFQRPCVKCFPEVITDMRMFTGTDKDNKKIEYLAWKRHLIDNYSTHAFIGADCGTGRCSQDKIDNWSKQYSDQGLVSHDRNSILAKYPEYRWAWATSRFEVWWKLAWHMLGYFLDPILTTKVSLKDL